jgi:hypothetical protein
MIVGSGDRGLLLYPSQGICLHVPLDILPIGTAAFGQV